MILPAEGTDDLGEPVKASNTLVRFKLELGLRSEASPHRDAGPLELIKESLVPLRKGDLKQHLPFPHSKDWEKSVCLASHASKFISTDEGTATDEGIAAERMVGIHQDGRSGRLFRRQAARQPRTLLSTIQSGEYPTAVLVRREMQSWRLLHLESSFLRRPDKLSAPRQMTSAGEHLPSALFHRAHDNATDDSPEKAAASREAVYASVSNRLAELIDNVRSITVERDDAQQLLTLKLTTLDGTVFPASALSDGTLRFLALTVAELDRRDGGLLCFEEPENGIHPGRVPAMLRLLQAMSSDVSIAADAENPLRQVIINTHSPGVVTQCPDVDLLCAESVESMEVTPSVSGQKPLRFRALRLRCLEGTWRATLPGHSTVGLGNLLAYLNPSRTSHEPESGVRRVAGRPEFQIPLPLPSVG